MKQSRIARPLASAALALALLPFSHGAATAGGPPIVVGLDADMSSGAAVGGEAIRRGVLVAMDEINRAGGVLGRPLRLVVRDHRGIPARGRDNISEFAAMRNLVAVVGGIHTPVALAEMELIHAKRIIYLGPWAAGTTVVENGHSPNYVFRVSVRDEYAGAFLGDMARHRGFRRPGLLLERTGWGRSNEKAFKASMNGNGMNVAGVSWFNWGQRDLSGNIRQLRAANADVIMLVANAAEGLLAVRAMAALPKRDRLPIISHWGITGGDFHALAGRYIRKVDLTFLQTYSFVRPPLAAPATRMLKTYRRMYPRIRNVSDIRAPVGTAHAYDLIHMLARAIARAGTIDRPAVREAMENLGRFDGLVRVYDPPFTAADHDALDRRDFRLARYNRSGRVVPAE